MSVPRSQAKKKRLSASSVQPPKETAAVRAAPRRRVMWIAAVAVTLAAGLALVTVAANLAMNRPEPPVVRPEVIAVYPHAEDAFTQGLVFENGILYEGVGGHGTSSLREVDLATGNVLRRVDLEERHFGEGIAVVGDEVYQLTWRSRVGFVYDKATFRKLREFRYSGEGWGLAFDGRHLIMSDGTEMLRFMDPRTFREARRLQVTSAGRRLSNLNELEFAGGHLYANIWHSDYIVKISPRNGQVVAWYDMRGLLPPEQRRDREAVLNGIAYDAASDRFYVTGKNWPSLFEVRLPDPASTRDR